MCFKVNNSVSFITKGRATRTKFKLGRRKGNGKACGDSRRVAPAERMRLFRGANASGTSTRRNVANMSCAPTADHSLEITGGIINKNRPLTIR